MITRLRLISRLGLGSLKRPKSIANGLFGFHVVTSERVLEGGDVAPGTGFVKFDVKVHDRIHGREGGYEETHIALRSLPKMI